MQRSEFQFARATTAPISITPKPLGNLVSRVDCLTTTIETPDRSIFNKSRHTASLSCKEEEEESVWGAGGSAAGDGPGGTLLNESPRGLRPVQGTSERVTAANAGRHGFDHPLWSLGPSLPWVMPFSGTVTGPREVPSSKKNDLPSAYTVASLLENSLWIKILQNQVMVFMQHEIKVWAQIIANIGQVPGSCEVCTHGTSHALRDIPTLLAVAHKMLTVPRYCDN